MPDASSQQVMDFFAIVLKDSALLERLIAAIDAGNDAAMIGMVGEYGYNFNQEVAVGH